MRILIGNHIDPSIRNRGDLAAWTQRVLWFAADGDLVVLAAPPDPQFLPYLTALTGVDPAGLQIVVAPPGRYGHRLLDPASLTDPGLLAEVTAIIGGAEVEEVWPLWPSPSVAAFADALGLADRLAGAAFFAQGGGELVNNKAVFRALAAGCGAPISPGAVVRDPGEATDAMESLLPGTGGVLVKQAHNGAGVGNEIVLATGADLADDHVGARHLHRLAEGRAGIEAYWAQRWEWASAGGRYPVVVEEFQPDAVTIYSEHHVTDTCVAPAETGQLLFVGRRLSHQIVPLAHVSEISENARTKLVRGGTLIASAWRAVGYRGRLSADAILTADGRVLFTEVNAQVSGSLHIYEVIARRIVRTAETPRRTVVEYHVPPTWAVPDFATFLTACEELGCGWNPEQRTGVIVSMPVIPIEKGRAQFVFCLAYTDPAHRDAVFAALDDRFAAIPADQIGPDPVGIAPGASS
ncbi:hypothetical protein ACFY4C_40985 [Actinomadura viridis]|uniref:preATP grasp domain-containing protein n=1 Tax=Actinomadura viridis TaxID=58110 RepID=UPI00369BF44C